MRFLLVCIAALASLLSPSAEAFGPTGHRMIGALADAQLTPEAAAAVKKAIGLTLRDAGPWADCVRDVERTSAGKFMYAPDPRYAAPCKVFGTTRGIARMKSYARRNWDNCNDPAATKGCHALYHFADVPIQDDHYERAFTGTSDHDIVSAIQAAMAKLRGEPVPPPFSIKDNAEAILMLAHLVGDLHQPLHVGAIYLDANNLPVDPGPVTSPHDPALDTRGGNKLEVGGTNLHANWDGIASTYDPLHLSTEMIALSKAVPVDSGDPDSWPSSWASETVRASQGAYTGMTFTHDGAKMPGDWTTQFSDRSAYLEHEREVQKQAMATAGARLAEILNATLK